MDLWWSETVGSLRFDSGAVGFDDIKMGAGRIRTRVRRCLVRFAKREI